MSATFSAGSRILLLVCIAIFAVIPASGQQEPSSIFGEQVEVRVVNLEVVVTDRDGERVRGLSDEDFQLRVDGKAMPISFFSEIAEGRRVEPAAGVATLNVERPSINLTGAEPGEAVGTNFLVFVDNFFTTRARDRNQVLKNIAEQIPSLGPADRMALVAFDGRNLQMLSGWSNSPRQLAAAFNAASGLPVSGNRTASSVALLDSVTAFDQGNAQSSQDTAFGGAGLSSGNTVSASTPEGRAAATVNIIENHLERVVLGVTASMRSFGHAEGRKVMLLLSGGWPQSVCDYATGPIDPISSSGECVNRGPALLRPIYEMANLLGFTLYPIDVPRNVGIDVDASENDLIGLARNGPGVGGAGGGSIVPSAFRQSELHGTLRKMAEETGGVAMINEARLSSMETIIDDTRSYYWLGFTPEWKGNDRPRKIRLETTRPGLKIRYREGFKDLSRSKEVDFIVESALLFGNLPGTGRLGVQLGAFPERGRRAKVPVSLIIPMDEITMLPHRGRFVAELELRVAALDEHGDRNEIAAVPVKIDGDALPPKGAHAIYDLELKLERQSQNLVVSLYDPIGDRMLISTNRLEL